jgi:ethanolamine transporter EutH
VLITAGPVYHAAASTSTADVLVSILSAVLIPRYGAMGAAVAMALAFMVEF